MLERAIERGREIAQRRVRKRIEEMAVRIGAEVPPGVVAAAEEEGIILSGLALGRRFALDPVLRWMRFR